MRAPNTEQPNTFIVLEGTIQSLGSDDKMFLGIKFAASFKRLGSKGQHDFGSVPSLIGGALFGSP